MLQPGSEAGRYTLLAVQRLRAVADHLILVAGVAHKAAYESLLADVSIDQHINVNDGELTTARGFRDGLRYVVGKATADRVIFTGSHCIGPLGDVDRLIDQMEAEGSDCYAPYFYNTDLDVRLTSVGEAPLCDFMILNKSVFTAKGFADFLATVTLNGNYWDEFKNFFIGLGTYLKSSGAKISYRVDPDDFGTMDPRTFEVHGIMSRDPVVIPLSVFSLDPLFYDLYAIELRDALDALRDRYPEDYAAVLDYLIPRQELREFNARADQFEILPSESKEPEKDSWSFGTVAVFIHAFYADMMPEFWGIIQRLPGAFDLFITTANEPNRKEIEGFLAEKLDESRFEVRVVEKNRGRDMSSLFITFRDVILADRYEVALRLHSKRTPQVPRSVSASFKAHLFDNLAHSEGYVRNVYNLMEAEPDLGLLVPPTIHIGFGTLGHSWNNNYAAMSRLATDMGLKVPFDKHTPVAPYGTMYWFRTDALRRMFEWEWAWDNYNAEPNHVDGGLAHVQERLIGYCAQARGYRVVSIMTMKQAARNYAKLEYKLQLLSSYMPTGNVIQQREYMESVSVSLKLRLYRRLEGIYFWLTQRFPWMRAPLKPVVALVQNLLLSVKKT